MLHVVYRSTGRENRKPRPPFYHKQVSLLSFLRTAEACETPVEIVFLNDGPIPPERLQLMSAAGDISSVPLATELPGGARARHALRHGRGGGGPIRSYLEALALVHERGWPDDDLVYFVEDDYLHRPEALEDLLAAAEAVPQASYFAPSGSIIWPDTDGFVVGNRNWFTAESCTFTYAARISALKDDRLIHRIGVFAGNTFDRAICRTYQGIRPYQWNHMVGDLISGRPGPAEPFSARMKRISLQTVMNLFAIKVGVGRRQVLIVPEPAQAAHLELATLPPGIDWAAVAADTAEWAKRSGLQVA
jgi:hypothetical protein